MSYLRYLCLFAYYVVILFGLSSSCVPYSYVASSLDCPFFYCLFGILYRIFMNLTFR